MDGQTGKKPLSMLNFFFEINDFCSKIFSLLLRPNAKCPVMANLETRGKNYTSNRDLCVKDSCTV